MDMEYTMALRQSDGTYRCSYCGKSFSRSQEADSCRDSHQLIYVPLTKNDLNHLINFIYSKDEKLLTESLMKTLIKYSTRRRNLEA